MRVRAVGGVLWLASAIEIKSRLWLGSEVSARRDRCLIRALLWLVQASCSCGSVAGVLL